MLVGKFAGVHLLGVQAMAFALYFMIPLVFLAFPGLPLWVNVPRPFNSSFLGFSLKVQLDNEVHATRGPLNRREVVR